MTTRTVRSHRARRVRAACLGALCVLTAHAAAAQSRASAAPSALRLAEAPRGDDEVGGWHIEQCMAGLTYGAPFKLALSYGGGLLHESASGPDICALAVAKLGFGGVQGSLGAGTSFAPWGTGVMITGNLLRTFGGPWVATPRSTYVGASLHLWPAFALGGEIAYYSRVGGDPGTNAKHFVGWSAGFGF